ncbi:RDD family protein [Simiduia agarivorans]|uniref:RDD family protein n=1 Tax=Simiduia agarivorans (strain DSM 21679 / JCM 13881 / BCRC 17597 / SA1) TaxID=1117647 RepID=K4KGR9_SIMAS|nr:RDD family protein [Simiduia agarivorans]AFU98176.1 putative RDD family protein [Simiduia agarivorans SA1 = DSM 21679]
MSDVEFPSLLRRLGAMVYDSLLVIAVCLLYGAIALAVQVNLSGGLADGEKANLGPLGFVGMLAVIGLYFTFFWVRSGQTLGMKTWRLKIVAHDGRRLGWGQAWLRWLLSCFSLGLAGTGFLWALIDRENQTLHDLLSKSQTRLLPKGQ